MTGILTVLFKYINLFNGFVQFAYFLTVRLCITEVFHRIFFDEVKHT